MALLDPTPPESVAIEEFKVLAEALPCIVWISDVAGEIEWCADDLYKYTGLSPNSALGWGWMRSVHYDDQPSLMKKWTHSLACETDLEIVVHLRNTQGFFRAFMVRARLFRNHDGALAKWFGTFTDIQDRQVAIEANDHLVTALMKGYLSKKWPSVHGIAFDTHYRAANVLERLGGDWYDIFTLPDGRTAFSLGDVCGHGIDAAVKMGEAKQAIAVAACINDPAPDRVLENANTVIFLNDHHVTITTALYGIIDTKRRIVTYAAAGHHPPVLARPNAPTEVLPNHGFPLGVEETMPPLIRVHEFGYERGSMMVLYTDGIIEFDRDIFDGEARLLAASAESVRSSAAHPAQFIVNSVLGDAIPTDDVVVLTISFQD